MTIFQLRCETFCTRPASAVAFFLLLLGALTGRVRRDASGVLGTMTGHLQRSTNKKPVVRVARAAKMAEIPVEPVAPSVTHPTSPLTALECQTAVEVVKAKYGDVIGDVRFEMAMLEEPCKKALRAGVVPPRLARIHAYPGQKNFGILPGVYHGVVNVETEEVVAWQFLPEAMPMRGGSNWMAAMKLCKEDPRIVEALSRRGIDDMDRVVMEPWPTGPTAKTFENAPFDYSETDAVWKDELGKYTAYVHMWVRLDGDLDNYYAHPIDGLKAVIDVGNMDILAVEDTDDSIPIPMEMNNCECSARRCTHACAPPAIHACAFPPAGLGRFR